MTRASRILHRERLEDRRDRNQKLERGLLRFREQSGISKRFDWQRNGGQRNVLIFDLTFNRLVLGDWHSFALHSFAKMRNPSASMAKFN